MKLMFALLAALLIIVSNAKAGESIKKNPFETCRFELSRTKNVYYDDKEVRGDDSRRSYCVFALHVNYLSPSNPLLGHLVGDAIDLFVEKNGPNNSNLSDFGFVKNKEKWMFQGVGLTASPGRAIIDNGVSFDEDSGGFILIGSATEKGSFQNRKGLTFYTYRIIRFSPDFFVHADIIIVGAPKKTRSKLMEDVLMIIKSIREGTS